MWKARREAGIEPEKVLGIYDLGIGRTEFPASMRYVSMAADAEGLPQESARNIRLANPQRTLNRNLVLVVNTDVVIADQSVEHLVFLSQENYADPQTRAQFCQYEQTFIDAIFEGWSSAKLQGRSLQGTFE